MPWSSRLEPGRAPERRLRGKLPNELVADRMPLSLPSTVYSDRRHWGVLYTDMRFRSAGDRRTSAARRKACEMAEAMSAPGKRRRLVGKQTEFGVAPGCEMSYDASWAAWDQKALIAEWRLISADAQQRLPERSNQEHLRLLQGLAVHIPEEIRVATGFNAKWAKLMSASGVPGCQLTSIPFLAKQFHDDMEDLAAMAFSWHNTHMRSVVEHTERRVLALLAAGAPDEAIALHTALIKPLENGHHWSLLRDLFLQKAAIHLTYLDFDRAEECADYWLGHWSPRFREYDPWYAEDIKKRAAVGRRRGLYRGTKVRICNWRSFLDGQLGEIMGREGTTRCLSPDVVVDDDVYEVRVGTELFTIQQVYLCSGPIVVQLSVRDREDGSVGVIGTTLSGTECAQFVVEPADLLHPLRMIARAARAMGRHPADLQCVMPDGSLAQRSCRGDSRGRTPHVVHVGPDRRI